MARTSLLHLMVAFGIVSSAGPALAQDAAGLASAQAASARWSGFYAGVNAGVAAANATATSEFLCPPGPAGFCWYNNNSPLNQANLTAFGNGASGALSDRGFTGGVQAGVNWLSGVTLFGAEVDFGSFQFSGKHETTALTPTVVPPIDYTASASMETNWLLTARGRLGWAATESLLLYGTGGVAVSEARVTNAFRDADTPSYAGGSSTSQLLVGPVVGAGAEWALDRHWSFKADYLYADLGSVTTSASLHTTRLVATDNILTSKVVFDAQIVRVGINHKF